MKGRFAPTPSGRMHLGNLFTALLGWLSVRRQGGRLLLRIEDLDTQRTTPELAAQLMDDLLWLGLGWDEGPTPQGGAGEDAYWQSRRTGFYEEVLETLAARGLVYPCFCSRAALHRDAAAAPHLGEGSYVYSGACRALSEAEIREKTRIKSPCLRALVPEERVSFCDGLQGQLSQHLSQECGDFIVRRADGVFAYQLAVAADDGAMGVSEVVRGRDLLPSTPRQLWLLRELGYPAPRYIHTPLLLAPDGRRLAKRDEDLDAGVLRGRMPPEALLGKLGVLAGLLPRYRPVSAEALLAEFSWGRVPREDIVVPPGFLDEC